MKQDETEFSRRSRRIADVGGKRRPRAAVAGALEGASRTKPSAKRKRPRGKPNLARFDDPAHPYTEAQKRLMKKIQDALDRADSFHDDEEGDDGVRAEEAHRRLFDLAAEACRSDNPAVRKVGIEAYSWKGESALAELTPLMADPNEEVAEMAIDAVEQALEDQDSPQLRFETAAAYMSTFSANEDALDMLEGSLVSAAMDIIEPEDDSQAAQSNARSARELVVDTLATMIESGSAKCQAAAREAYSDITSEDWIDASEAELWVRDPDNYEAPE